MLVVYVVSKGETLGWADLHDGSTDSLQFGIHNVLLKQVTISL